MLVIIVYDVFFVPKGHIPQKVQSEKAVSQEQKKVFQPATPKIVPIKPLKVKPTQDLGKEVIVSTPLYKAVFCTNGAKIKDFLLKRYRQTVDPHSPPVHLIRNNGILPLAIRFLHRQIPIDNINYQVDKPVLNLSKGGAPQTITFTASVSGLVIKKSFTFHSDDYRIDMKIQISNQGLQAFSDNLIVFLANKWPKKKDRYGFRGAIYYADNKFSELKWEKIKGEIVKAGKFVWAGLTDKYFMTVITNTQPKRSSFIVYRLSESRPSDSGEALVGEWLTPPLELKPNQVANLNYLLYFGPKELDRLKKIGYHLDKAVHFGFFDTIAKWLLYVLKWFYKYTHNYGIAIIILTLVIKILFWPLTHMSYESMQRMQKLQPHIQRLKEKYKDDKEALNRELMKLYKTYKVNPMGGCLPMILQIPVFFALYMALAYAIELRHAPFIMYLPFTHKLWLADLSAKDPYYITPILMGISMFVQQKMTPSTMDPSQAKFMHFMPIIFTFLFLNFPSGLVLYWFVNNLLSIVQQAYVNRKLGG